jgi:hypothetical protein
MLGEGGIPLSKLQAAIREFLARDERGNVDLPQYRAAIDALEGDFGSEARDAQKAGAHLVNGSITAASWIARTCNMSVHSAADRLCVGAQLEDLPQIKAALASGEIGYQSVAILSHLRDKLGEKRELFDEEEMLDLARRHSVFHLRRLCDVARHVADPDGFFNEAEESYLRRGLHISQMSDGMYKVDGVLDPVTGASLKTAAETLAKRQGPEDERKHSQRMHDALGEMVNHALGQGTLPRRHGVKPHINLTTTIEGLKNELGVPPAELELSLPISTRTLERIACDCTMSRVLLADSMVIDVGRATRVVSAPTMRALRVRDKGCRFPGCDRQVNWSSAHHVDHWSRGGPSNLPNLVLLCHYHHRLVHEGGWQVIKVGREFQFLPPDRVVMRRVRGPGMRWAA